MQTVELIIMFLVLFVIIGAILFSLGVRKKTMGAIFLHVIFAGVALLVVGSVAEVDRENILMAVILGAFGVALPFIIK